MSQTGIPQVLSCTEKVKELEFVATFTESFIGEVPPTLNCITLKS